MPFPLVTQKHFIGASTVARARSAMCQRRERVMMPLVSSAQFRQPGARDGHQSRTSGLGQGSIH